jgi:hypothetical protein
VLAQKLSQCGYPSQKPYYMLLFNLQTENYFNGFDYNTMPGYAPTFSAYAAEDIDDDDDDDDDDDEDDDLDDTLIDDTDDDLDFDDSELTEDDFDDDDLDEDDEDDDDEDVI